MLIFVQVAGQMRIKDITVGLIYVALLALAAGIIRQVDASPS
jgi:hypothetical protein